MNYGWMAYLANARFDLFAIDMKEGTPRPGY
jgi:hypothetical protein